LALKADALFILGRYDESRQLAAAVVERNPQHGVANAVLGKIAVDLGDLPAARTARQRLEAGAHWQQFYILHGKIERKEGRFDEAVRSFGSAMNNAANASDSREQRAYTALLGGNFVTAQVDNLWLLRRFGTNDFRANGWLVEQYLALRGRGWDGEAALHLENSLR